MVDLNKRKADGLYHIIYYEWHTDIRAGGPTGYLANLQDGINRIENSVQPQIFFDTAAKQQPDRIPEPKGVHRWFQAFFSREERRKRFYINHISRSSRRGHENYVRFLSNSSSMECMPELFGKIDLERTKTIHVHTVGDAVKVKNSLEKAGAGHIKLMLTSHTPEAASQEYYNGYLEQQHSITRAQEIRRLWQQVERRAFEASDILVFPSKEAMEPLQLTMDGFDRLISGKDIRFVPSGVKKLSSAWSKEEAKKKYGLEGKFLVGYVGRHNAVKGYDILQRAAKIVWKKQRDICFLIGGVQGNAFRPLDHKGWIEAGWVDPADLFQALDVFVLPNRMTYFDLVLLEVMSMGIPAIASDTGGNRTVQETTDALLLFDGTPEDLAGKILDFSRKPGAVRDAVGKKAQAAYGQYYTAELFAQRYVDLMHQIYMDYGYVPVGR